MNSTMARVFYNWMLGYRALKGQALTREDYSASWGKLGESVYDWGSNLYKQGAGDTVRDEAVFQSTVDKLVQTNPVGGTIGQTYAMVPPSSTPGTGGVGAVYGNLGVDMYDQLHAISQGSTGGTKYDANGNPIPGGVYLSPADQRNFMVRQYGDLGGKVYDWWFNQMQLGKDPDRATFASQVDSMAGVTAPGGTAGGAYAPALTADEKERDWRHRYDENLQAIDKAIRERNAAELERANRVRETLDREKFNLDKVKADAEMQANPRDWVKAWYYQRGLQPPAQASTAPATTQDYTMNDGRKVHIEPGGGGYIYTPGPGGMGGNYSGLPPQISPVGGPGMTIGRIGVNPAGTTPTTPPATQGVGGLPVSYPSIQTPMGPRVGDTLQYQPFRPGSIAIPGIPGRERPSPASAPTETPPTPPWLTGILQNKRAPAFNASSGTLGTFPIEAPDPNQVSARSFNSLAPSEQAGLEGLASSSGWYWPDYIRQMINSQNRQPGISRDSLTSWAGF